MSTEVTQMSTELTQMSTEVAQRGVTICDPRPADRASGTSLAPRLDSLDRATIALIHNGKTHGRELMEFVVDELRERWDIAGVSHVGPPSPGYGGDPAQAAPAAEAVMAAISAVGD